jgi:hypothetical protein
LKNKKIFCIVIFKQMRHKEIEPIKSDKLLIVENGIDLRYGFHGWGKQGPKSVAYEDFCFRSIANELNPGNFAIGPHLIDRVFGISSAVTTGVARPDAIIFDVNSPDQWKIKRLCEFKSGKGNGIVNKLNGFSKLLSHLREHEHFLPALLMEYLEKNINIPPVIIIPQDNQVEVTIIKPKIGEADIFYSDVKFPVLHRKMQLS